MQEDADRFVNTWSNVGDAMLRYQNNQRVLLDELARIFASELRAEVDDVARPAGVMAGMGPHAPIGHYYGGAGTGQQHYDPYAQTGVAPPTGNGYGNGGYYEQGYPPQPYQEHAAPAQDLERPISQVLKNLRRQQS